MHKVSILLGALALMMASLGCFAANDKAEQALPATKKLAIPPVYPGEFPIPAATLSAVADPYPPSCQPDLCPLNVQASGTEQIAYRGLIPGTSTAAEVLRVLGEPYEIIESPDREQWLYWEEDVYQYYIYIRDNVIETISTQIAEDERPTVAQLLEQYGCPEFVVAKDTNIHPSGVYDGAELLYLARGAVYYVSAFPFSTSNEASGILYLPPGRRADFFSRFSEYKSDLVAKVVPWCETMSPD